MLQQDYLMRLLVQFVEGIRRSMEKGKYDPESAADSLEDALSRAIDMDAGVMLGLEPESFAGIMQISALDPRVVEYVVRSLSLEAHYLDRAGFADKANLRYEQACALARAYGVFEPARDDIPTDEEFQAFFDENDQTSL